MAANRMAADRIAVRRPSHALSSIGVIRRPAILARRKSLRLGQRLMKASILRERSYRRHTISSVHRARPGARRNRSLLTCASLSDRPVIRWRASTRQLVESGGCRYGASYPPLNAREPSRALVAGWSNFLGLRRDPKRVNREDVCTVCRSSAARARRKSNCENAPRALASISSPRGA